MPTNQSIIKIIISFVVFCTSVLLLQLLSLHNGFPLLLGDSKNYIWMGLHFIENSHWSNTYIYFVGKNIQLFNTIEYLPLFQNIMILSLIFSLCHLLFRKNILIKYLAIAFGLIFTALPWISNMVMTDISTSLCLLIILILVNYRLKLKQTIPLYLAFLMLVSWHQSHIVIMPMFLVAALIVKLLQNRSNIKQQLKWIGYNTLPIIILLVASFVLEKQLLNPPPSTKKTSNTEGAKTGDTSSGYYFVGVRLWEVNELDNLLSKFCPDNPDNYLCDPNNTSEIKVQISKFRERNQENEDYLKLSLDNKEFILSCLTKPRFYYALMKVTFQRSFNLLKHTRIKRYEPSIADEPKIGSFNKSFQKISKKELREFRHSKQKNGKYVGKFYPKYLIMDKIWWYGILPLVILFWIFIKYKNRGVKLLTKESVFVLLALPLAHLVNTVICGTFSNANNFRYSSRTVWLLNLAIILLFIFVVEAKRKIQSSQNEINRTDTLS